MGTASYPRVVNYNLELENLFEFSIRLISQVGDCYSNWYATPEVREMDELSDSSDR